MSPVVLPSQLLVGREGGEGFHRLTGTIAIVKTMGKDCSLRVDFRAYGKYGKYVLLILEEGVVHE